MMSREWELNPQPPLYESGALPLSYLGVTSAGRVGKDNGEPPFLASLADQASSEIVCPGGTSITLPSATSVTGIALGLWAVLRLAAMMMRCLAAS